MMKTLSACEIWLTKLWYSIIDRLLVMFIKSSEKHIVHITQDEIEIFVERGKKTTSPYDFIVKFRDPKRSNYPRTPKHIHLIVELYVKEAFNKQLTHKLRDHLLWVFDQVKPIQTFPPSLQVFQPQHVLPFKVLDQVGEFSVEFLLVVSELIFIQEKTNYPKGSLTRQLYEDFGQKDRFSVIHMAAFRGR